MNKVIAGRFKNKHLFVNHEYLQVRLGWRKQLLLTPEIVDRVQIINTTSAPSVASGFWRGFLSRMIPSTTLWLSSVLSAKRNTTYTVKVTYRDYSSSILQINARYFAVLAIQNTLIS